MSESAQRATQALLVEVRWRLESGERRIDAVAQRVAIVLGLDGVLLSVLIATLNLPVAVIQGTGAPTIAAVVLLGLSIIGALHVLWPRSAPTPSRAQMRTYWSRVLEGREVDVEGELVNAYLGGQKDPLAAMAKLIDCRSKVYAVSLALLVVAMTLTGVVVVLTVSD